jgi:hypothetical protein
MAVVTLVTIASSSAKANPINPVVDAILTINGISLYFAVRLHPHIAGLATMSGASKPERDRL